MSHIRDTANAMSEEDRAVLADAIREAVMAWLRNEYNGETAVDLNGQHWQFGFSEVIGGDTAPAYLHASPPSLPTE